MSEKEFHNADLEVIRMVNRSHSSGGQLPRSEHTFIPKDRAERVLQLDHRIELVRKAMPLVICGTICMASIILASVQWIHPVLAALIILASLLQGMGTYRRT